jgi:SAM-dependent methyltransferase
VTAQHSNPFEDSVLAARYQAWYSGQGAAAARQERALLRWVLAKFPAADTLLEVGCGTGEFTRWFRWEGLRTLGVDASWPMLAEAGRLDSGACVCAEAEALPFPDGAFDLTALVTTLEFVRSPAMALREAYRVARSGLVLGVINRTSLLGRRYRHTGGLWDAAHFFAPGELTEAVLEAVGPDADISWRTTLWPGLERALPLPWGGFIGMGVVVNQRR